MSRLTAGLLAVLALLVGAIPSRAQTESASLSVINPRTGAWVGQGTIEAATVLVRPKGVYAEVSLYLTYSARSANATDADTLEIAHAFSLPSEASVVDSWLWMEDDTTIVRAGMLDLARATQIYENIVHRARPRDPSVLYKRSNTWYELNVYPIKRTQRRRVKITYLVPYRITADDRADVPLPSAMLTTSRFPVVPTVITWPESPDAMPAFAEDPDRPFRWNTDAVRGTYVYSAIPALTRERRHVRFPRPWSPDASMQVYPEGNGGWYALTLPFTPAQHGRKVVVALNLPYGNDADRAGILPAVQRALQAALNPRDSLFLLASRDRMPLEVTSGWISADPVRIGQAFDAIGATSDSSRLMTLLPAAVAHANTRVDARVILINISSAEAPLDRVNAVLDALPSVLPRVHIYDPSTFRRSTAYPYADGSGRFYEAINDWYLHRIVVERSRGLWHLSPFASFASFEDVLRRQTAGVILPPALSSYDIAVENADGAVYALTAPAYLDRPHVRVGRYAGAPPTTVRLTGLLGPEALAQTFTVAPTVTDSTLKTLGWGQELRPLEALLTGYTATPDLVASVSAKMVDLSIRSNVLSLKTALLALDPSLGGVVCLSCVDEGANPPVSAERGERAEAASLRASPNPFRGTLSVRVTLALPTSTDDLRAEVYDMVGRRVRTLRIDESGVVSGFTLTWDGQTDAGARAAAGAYVVVITTPQGRLSQVVTLLD